MIGFCQESIVAKRKTQHIAVLCLSLVAVIIHAILSTIFVNL